MSTNVVMFVFAENNDIRQFISHQNSPKKSKIRRNLMRCMLRTKIYGWYQIFLEDNVLHDILPYSYKNSENILSFSIYEGHGT